MHPDAKALLETAGAELLTGQALLDHNDPEQANAIMLMVARRMLVRYFQLIKTLEPLVEPGDFEAIKPLAPTDA